MVTLFNHFDAAGAIPSLESVASYEAVLLDPNRLLGVSITIVINH